MNAAMAEKKRKRPERQFELKTLSLKLKDAEPSSSLKKFRNNAFMSAMRHEQSIAGNTMPTNND